MSKAKEAKNSAIAILGYSAWFCILVRLLYLATNEQSTGLAESIGVHLGVGLALLALLGIPYFFVRLRSKRRGEPTSWFLVMIWTTVIALLLSVGGFYGRLHTASQALGSSNAYQRQADPASGASAHSQPSMTNQPTTIAPANSIDSVPANAAQCHETYITRPSSVGNIELLRDYCRIATDRTLHPTQQARALCMLQEWSDLGKDPSSAMTVCEAKYPLPTCPNDMEFDLDNMRCEIKCDGLKGYAPDATGRSCYLACPNGGWPIYSGKVLGCN